MADVKLNKKNIFTIALLNKIVNRVNELIKTPEEKTDPNRECNIIFKNIIEVATQKTQSNN